MILYPRRVGIFDFNCLCSVLLQPQMEGTLESHLISCSAFRQKGATQNHLQYLYRKTCKKDNSTLLLGNHFLKIKLQPYRGFLSFGK